MHHFRNALLLLTASASLWGGAATLTPATAAHARNPQISLAPGPYMPGQLVLVHGTGFVPNEQVNMRLDVLSKTVRTDAAGRLTVGIYLPCAYNRPTAQITVPMSVEGRFSRTIRVRSAVASNTLAVGPTPFSAGKQIAVYGCFYAPSQHVTLTLSATLTDDTTWAHAKTVRVGGPGHFGPVYFRMPDAAQAGLPAQMQAVVVERNHAEELALPLGK
jgi:hypothetical protein